VKGVTVTTLNDTHTEDMASPDEIYLKVAERQLGIVTLEQLRSAGLSDSAIRRRVDGRRLERVLPGVVRICGSQRSEAQTLMAYLLYAGPTAALSHRSAARRWGWDPFCNDTHVELTVDRDLRVAGAHIYRGALPPSDVGILHRLRVTSPVRTIVDLAGVVTEEELEIALDCGLVVSRLDTERIRRALERIGRQGRRGCGVLHRLLGEREDGRPLGTSPLEVRFVRFLRRNRLPRPVSQYPISVSGRNFVLDFAYPERRLAIETDGYRWHASRERFESDRDKSNALSLEGWRLLRVTHKQMADQGVLLETMRRALGQEVLV